MNPLFLAFLANHKKYDAFTGDCGCSQDQVDTMFKRAEQYIDEEIAHRQHDMKRYWIDLYPTKPFPDGVGLLLEKTRFWGDIGPQYDGFDGWRKVQPTRTGDTTGPCGENDGCGYNWEDVGHGMETIGYDLMQRDLRTKPICIKDIRTFWQYEAQQNMIFQNLAEISANMREQLNRNATIKFALKYVALPGLPFSNTDPRKLPVIPPGVTVGKLTTSLLMQLYFPMAQEASQYSIGTVDGMAAFGVAASPETIQDMFLEDPNVRTDLRYCEEEACKLVKRYNFLDGFGPYIMMPDLYAPRYDRDADGNLYRVFPFDRNVPIEIGTRPATNPEYHNAEFELVLILTKDLLSLRTRKALTSVGGETNFGPESAGVMFDWSWHNPPCKEDPFRRVGRYVTTAEVGVEPGDFTEIAGILVMRKPGWSAVKYWEAAEVPPDLTPPPPVLDTEPCPCPQVIAAYPGVFPDQMTIVLDRPAEELPGDLVDPTDTVVFTLINGAAAAALVNTVSTDGKRIMVTFTTPVCPEPGHIVELRCSVVDWCTSDVVKSETCRAVAGQVDLYLERTLRVQTGTITLIMGDGTHLDRAIVTATASKQHLRVTLLFADYCDHKGVCSVCVPTATNATCPGCTGAVLEDCVPPTP